MATRTPKAPNCADRKADGEASDSAKQGIKAEEASAQSKQGSAEAASEHNAESAADKNVNPASEN
jgi:hypothetical protein